MNTTIYLMRHSEATPKTNLKYVSCKDNSQVVNEKAFLSVSGEKRAEEISKNEELQNIDAVYSSNYVRAMSTAKYIALENNTIVNIDDRLDERKRGNEGNLDPKDFERLQKKDFDFKMTGGESLNQTKKRMAEAMKSILMFETGNRVVVVSHSTAITALLTTWCDIGYNYDDDIILSYNDNAIVDGNWDFPHVIKLEFEGTTIKNIEYLSIM